jgi:hypothetical protein
VPSGWRLFSRSKKMADIFAAVDLTTVLAFITATGLIVIGANLAFKAMGLGKKAINKV